MLTALSTQFARRHRALEYCSSDRFAPEDYEHYLVNFPFIENDYHFDILLSFGEKCECLEPKHIRMELKRKIQAIAAIYEKEEPETS